VILIFSKVQLKIYDRLFKQPDTSAVIYFCWKRVLLKSTVHICITFPTINFSYSLTLQYSIEFETVNTKRLCLYVPNHGAVDSEGSTTNKPKNNPQTMDRSFGF
jgi:hypothetical protein